MRQCTQAIRFDNRGPLRLDCRSQGARPIGAIRELGNLVMQDALLYPLGFIAPSRAMGAVLRNVFVKATVAERDAFNDWCALRGGILREGAITDHRLKKD